ncbi:hypothetical protein PR048_023713 [Dryococelus australis]|uniref:Uncharacterized protein n=1 Tax=Dryococelus australis TaxID=614101 RepID=A0ABQ9GUW7_9NEOP|nr:hypothetical protein PR048_023713 [Dryococelus australis]
MIPTEMVLQRLLLHRRQGLKITKVMWLIFHDDDTQHLVDSHKHGSHLSCRVYIMIGCRLQNRKNKYLMNTTQYMEPQFRQFYEELT